MVSLRTRKLRHVYTATDAKPSTRGLLGSIVSRKSYPNGLPNPQGKFDANVHTHTYTRTGLCIYTCNLSREIAEDDLS